ncbi:MAG TPA: preprotein translocase subunit SecA [Candidatus Kapabacteria bacterium]|nr:preprotein translocase subunit SecA [Candidatus Kapabacteria bacterium]
MLKLLEKVFGSKKEKDVQGLLPIVDQINEEFAKLQSLSDSELQNKTVEFRARIKEATLVIENELAAHQEELKQDIPHEQRMNILDRIGELEEELNQEIAAMLDDLLPEAFAVVKEACRRHVGKTWTAGSQEVKWDMVPYDVQLIGGITLHQGKISEMATGEGKTLVAVMPLYLNALPEKGAHLVTVNDYLAQRDSEWMGEIFKFLGLSVGKILQPMQPWERKKEYACDITYGTNNEFGFDYLRDNMVTQVEDMVQRPHNYAIVDEVDSVLIDEARTPLIISGPVEASEHKFDEMKPMIEKLVNAQKNLVAKMISEAEDLLKTGDAEKRKEAGVLLVRAQHGTPKNKRLLKLFSDGEMLRLMQQTELEYMRDNSRNMHIIDDELYFIIEEKNHQIDVTDKGRDYLAGGGTDRDLFVLPDIATELSMMEHQELTTLELQQKKDELTRVYADRSDRLHTISQLLRAYCLYEKDTEYVVQDGKVMIVDEFTGRMLPGRRYSEGLHQAIEAKESVLVERDTQTLATITLQNYFRLYKKLAGMTGTAETEAGEFYEIYKLDVVVIPTNRPVSRDDKNDNVYRTRREKYNAVIEEIQQMRNAGRPVLVGTTSVEVSETIARMLKRLNVPHNVLNAKQHAREAEIVSHAGQKASVTIATNMAGRGTDIKLGPGVKDAGGLHIVGTERHEARRIDRQLRGRSGRQGDPGSSQFFISLEDDLMRLFGSERISGVMSKMGMKEGEVINHSMITRSVERAQKKVEENNFAIRKRLLEYDNVMNSQREVIYDRRRHALFGQRLKDEILEMLDESLGELVAEHFDQGQYDELHDEVLTRFMTDVPVDRDEWAKIGADGVESKLNTEIRAFYNRKEEQLGHELMAQLERFATLQVIDEKWRDHLREMDELKEGIGLRAYGQKDPLIEYKQEGYRMFTVMLRLIRDGVLDMVFKLYPQMTEQQSQQASKRLMPSRPATPRRIVATKQEYHSTVMAQPAAVGAGEPGLPPPPPQAAPRTPVRVAPKVGRNDPCPCGSGKKYKNCHGAGL